jgi:hypothetical protein
MHLELLTFTSPRSIQHTKSPDREMKHPAIRPSVSIRMSKFYHFNERTYADETNHSHTVFILHVGVVVNNYGFLLFLLYFYIPN